MTQRSNAWAAHKATDASSIASLNEGCPDDATDAGPFTYTYSAVNHSGVFELTPSLARNAACRDGTSAARRPDRGAVGSEHATRVYCSSKRQYVCHPPMH